MEIFDDLKFVLGEILRRYERDTNSRVGCLLYNPISDVKITSYEFNGTTFEEVKEEDINETIQTIN